MTKKDTWESILSRQGIQIKKQADSRLQRVIQVFLHRHFEQLTGIQSKAIPALFSGHDGILMSATASGKTEAAVIPVVEAEWDPDQRDRITEIKKRRTLNEEEAKLH